MRKKLFVVAAALFFIFILSSGVSAQFPLMLSGADLLMSDWQLDYIRPLEPGELKKGDYRLTPVIGRFDNKEKETNIFYPRNNYDYNNDSMFYLMAFDTAVTDNLLLHGKYLYKPYSEINDRGDENKTSLMDLFLDYKFENENKMFFGFNRSYNKNKDYDMNGVFESEAEDETDFYYLGFEIRGSFTGKNK